jgi:hypothetical protein
MFSVSKELREEYEERLLKIKNVNDFSRPNEELKVIVEVLSSLVSDLKEELKEV